MQQFRTGVILAKRTAVALAVIPFRGSLAIAQQPRPVRIIFDTDDPWSPLCLDALNTYYGRPEIPLGVVEDHAHLVEKMPPEEVARVIEALMIEAPGGSR
jgi:hypothetical protein